MRSPIQSTAIAPTTTYPNGTMTVGSTSTHDGQNMQVNDLIWIDTCTPGSDPGERRRR